MFCLSYFSTNQRCMGGATGQIRSPQGNFFKSSQEGLSPPGCSAQRQPGSSSTIGWGVTSAPGGRSHGQNSSRLPGSVGSETTPRGDCLLLCHQFSVAGTARQARFYSCLYSRVQILLSMLQAPQSLYEGWPHILSLFSKLYYSRQRFAEECHMLYGKYINQKSGWEQEHSPKGK